MTEHVLPFRSWTRAEMLKRVRANNVGVTLTPADLGLDPTDPAELAALLAQQLEDARLGVERPGPLRATYRRRPGSTVYHHSKACPAWPAEPPYEEANGWPGEGLGCRECSGLDRPYGTL